jgi:hypothetical protein
MPRPVRKDRPFDLSAQLFDVDGCCHRGSRTKTFLTMSKVSAVASVGTLKVSSSRAIRESRAARLVAFEACC